MKKIKQISSRVLFELETSRLCSSYVETQHLYFLLLWIIHSKHADGKIAVFVRRLLLNGIVSLLQCMYSADKGAISIPSCLRYGSACYLELKDISPEIVGVPFCDYSTAEISDMMNATYDVLVEISAVSKYPIKESMRPPEDMEDLEQSMKEAVRETFEHRETGFDDIFAFESGFISGPGRILPVQKRWDEFRNRTTSFLFEIL